MSNSCKQCDEPAGSAFADADLSGETSKMSPTTSLSERNEQRNKYLKVRQQYYYRLTVLRHPKCSVQLTSSELEVLKLMSEGYSNQSMAEHLSEKKSIIDASLLSMFNKLKANTRAEVIASASKLGLIAA